MNLSSCSLFCSAKIHWSFKSSQYLKLSVHLTLEWLKVPTHPLKSLKVLEKFFLLNSRPWKYLKTGQVLESPWIHQVKLCDISNFVKQHLCRFSGSFSFWFCETYWLTYFMLSSCFLSTTRSYNLQGILPNTRFANSCHVLFLSTKTVP